MQPALHMRYQRRTAAPRDTIDAAVGALFPDIALADAPDTAHQLPAACELLLVRVDEQHVTAEALSQIASTVPGCPIVLLIPPAAEQAAAALLGGPIVDYVLTTPPQLWRLAHAVQVAAKTSQLAQRLRTAEAALTLRERAIAALSDGLVIADARLPDYPLIACNPAFLAMTGYTEQQVLGRNCRFLQGPDTNPNSVHELRTRLRAGEECHVTLLNYRRDGTPFWNELTLAPVRDAAGQLTHFVGIQRDLTNQLAARRVVEDALRVAEARYRMLIENIPLAVSTGALDDPATSPYISPQITDLFGYSVEEWLAQPDLWRRLMHPDDLAHVIAAGAATGASCDFRVEMRQFHRDGHMLWVQYDQHIIVSEGQRYLIATISDITARRTAELALHESNEHLELLNQSLEQRVAERTMALHQANLELSHAGRLKDEFLTMMSHELRTPLTSILGRSELLLDDPDDPLTAQQQHGVARIEEAGRHLLALITDILDLSKIEAGKLLLYPEPVPVAALCAACLALVAEQAARKQIHLQTRVDLQTAIITADVRRLKQIVVNLLANAVKFTPQGGSVGIEVHGDAAARTVQFEVWDTGIGISRDDQLRLFQPFVQIDSSLTRHYAGTGLGLALVARLAALHGGQVMLSSTPGVGSRFTVTLPWEPGQADDSVVLPSAPPVTYAPQGDLAHSDGELVLLVEDDPQTQSMVEAYLHTLGYRVALADSGHTALTQAHALLPVLVLMDIQMPGMDGLTAIRNLRAEHAFADLPIIALSARAMPGDRELCLAAGANEYLSKPVRLRELGEHVAALLRAAMGRKSA